VPVAAPLLTWGGLAEGNLRGGRRPPPSISTR